ncbi:MAG TPA: XrtA system polysaccharide deacetylase, partial [Blastocatellia bacterium]|nr:XrtA system polysaccharide deacetylase [Blastocatellia bacterium]
VEDYYQVEAFTDVVRKEDWSQWESRVERNTQVLLNMFAQHTVQGTFFVLGYVAEQHPQLIRQIAQAGHEVACHSYFHRLVYSQTPEEFRSDLRDAKHRLEDLIGTSVIGYRAPSYSITAQSLWALDILIEEGFRYDSSIFPVHHDRYGMPNAERFPHLLHRSTGEIIEFPPSTVRIGKTNFPISGGGYFRLYPYWLFRRGWQRINRREAEAAIFFLHPWEVDPDQPIVPGTRLNIWRHRVNLRHTQAKLERLLQDFRFASVQQILAQRNLSSQTQEMALAATEV